MLHCKLLGWGFPGRDPYIAQPPLPRNLSPFQRGKLNNFSRNTAAMEKFQIWSNLLSLSVKWDWISFRQQQIWTKSASLDVRNKSFATTFSEIWTLHNVHTYIYMVQCYLNHVNKLIGHLFLNHLVSKHQYPIWHNFWINFGVKFKWAGHDFYIEHLNEPLTLLDDIFCCIKPPSNVIRSP